MSDLQSVILPSGLELFFADGDNFVQDVVAARPDLSVFFVLSSKEGGKGTEFLRVNVGMTGVAVNRATPDLGLTYIKDFATYAMPKIPRRLVNKIDQFFRQVDKEQSTEAIVLLTFDPTMAGDPNGWGVLVPRQTNSSGHCHYNVDQVVVDDKPDHVDIIGSAHSHPGMSAFASGTDHADQADFDGVHVTFGYPRKSLTTEFHAELQMGGGKWDLNLDMIFEDEADAELDEEVKSWSERVSKAHADPTTGQSTPTKHGAAGSISSGHSTHQSNGGSSTAPAADYLLKHLNDDSNRPYKCPNPNLTTILVNIHADDTSCPVCKMPLTQMAIEDRHCYRCTSYLLLGTEELEDIIELRRGRRLPIYPLDYTANPDTVSKPITWWRRNIGPSGYSAGTSDVIVIFDVETDAGNPLPFGGSRPFI